MWKNETELNCEKSNDFNTRDLFKKYREFWNSASFVNSIFDFWWCYVGSHIFHLCRQVRPFWIFSKFLTAILLGRILTRFRFLPLQFREQESHRGPDLENTVVVATLLCCFCQKIRVLATMCEQGDYHGAKANFCSSTNPGVPGGLLPVNYP